MLRKTRSLVGDKCTSVLAASAPDGVRRMTQAALPQGASSPVTLGKYTCY